MEADLKNKVEHIDGTNSDIIKILEKNFPEAARQTRQFSKRFDAPTIEQVAENIWNFLKENVKYVSDGSEHQKIRLPARLIHDKVGDCKSFALFAAANLSHYTEVGFRYSSYRKDPTPTHVYAIAKDEDGNTIIIDGVWHTFNDEKNFSHKKDHWMKISTLSGITAAPQPNEIPQIKVDEYTYHSLQQWNHILNSAPKGSKDFKIAQTHLKELMQNIGLDKKSLEQASKGIGKFHLSFKHLKDKVHSVLKGAWNGFKHYNPGFATIRNSYLALLDINYRGQASRIVEQLSKDPEPLRKVWHDKFGGNFDRLVNAAKRGAKHKPLFGRPKGVNGPELVLAIIATAAPLIAAISKVIPKGKTDTGETGLDDLSYQKLPGYDERADESSPYYDPTFAATHPNPGKSTDDVADVPKTTTEKIPLLATIIKDGQQVVSTIAHIVNPQDETGATSTQINTPQKESAGMGTMGIILVGGIAVTYLFTRKK